MSVFRLRGSNTQQILQGTRTLTDIVRRVVLA